MKSSMPKRIRIFAAKYGIMQAPTLVVVDGDNMKKYVNASNIQKYLETHWKSA